MKKKLFGARPNLLYYKVFHRKSIINRMKKTQMLIKIPVYLGLPILKLSKILNEFCSDCVKLKYRENAKLCCMHRDSFSVYIKVDDIYIDIAEDVENKFDTSNYELDRALLKEKNKKVIGLMKNGLGGKIKTKFVGLRTKTYSY